MSLHLQDFTTSNSILIVDKGRAYTAKSVKWTGTFLTLDRIIYLRLQSIEIAPLGSLPQDLVNPLKDFIAQFNAITNGETVSNEYSNADVFLGSLGITQYYPHSDNTYKGELGQ